MFRFWLKFIQVALEQKVQVLEMQRHAKVAGLFSLRLHEQSPIKLEQQISTEPQSGRDDIALVLHTSGTTKKPKIAALPVYICLLSISYLFPSFLLVLGVLHVLTLTAKILFL